MPAPYLAKFECDDAVTELVNQAMFTNPRGDLVGGNNALATALHGYQLPGLAVIWNDGPDYICNVHKITAQLQYAAVSTGTEGNVPRVYLRRGTAPLPGRRLGIIKRDTNATDLPSQVFASLGGQQTDAANPEYRDSFIIQGLVQSPTPATTGIGRMTALAGGTDFLSAKTQFSSKSVASATGIVLRENESISINWATLPISAGATVPNKYFAEIVFTDGTNTFDCKTIIYPGAPLILGNQTGSGVVLTVRKVNIYGDGIAAATGSTNLALVVMPIFGIGQGFHFDCELIKMDTGSADWPSQIVLGKNHGVFIINSNSSGNDEYPYTSVGRRQGNGLNPHILGNTSQGQHTGTSNPLYYVPAPQGLQELGKFAGVNGQQFVLRPKEGLAVLLLGVTHPLMSGAIDIGIQLSFEAVPTSGGGGDSIILGNGAFSPIGAH